MANEKQETINSLWIKYKNNLEMLDGALDKLMIQKTPLVHLRLKLTTYKALLNKNQKKQK